MKNKGIIIIDDPYEEDNLTPKERKRILNKWIKKMFPKRNLKNVPKIVLHSKYEKK